MYLRLTWWLEEKSNQKQKSKPGAKLQQHSIKFLSTTNDKDDGDNKTQH